MRLDRWSTPPAPVARWRLIPALLVPCLAIAGGLLLPTRPPAAPPATQPTPEPARPLAAPAEPLLVDVTDPPSADEQPPAEPEQDTVAPKPSVSLHAVEEGESVRSIAALYGISPDTVLIANALEDPDLLRIGQQLVVPSRDGVVYTVGDGDTLRSIAERYGVDLGELIAANPSASPDLLAVGTVLVVPGAKPLTRVREPEPDQSSGIRRAAVVEPEPSLSTAASGPVAAPETYVVREGDTLRTIAEAFGLDILSLVSINGLVEPNLLRPGTTLRTSSVDTLEHTVEPGETLADIAWRYSVESSLLLEANGLRDPDLLMPGTVLVVPGGNAPPAAAPPVAAAPPILAPPAAAPSTAAPAPAPARPRPTATPAPQPPTDERLTTARVTGYALGAGAVSTRTASGTRTHWGTVAADTHLYPFGTRLRIEGFDDMVFVVEDTGGAVRGNVFDVWFPDAASARRLGARTRQVTILSFAPGGQ